MTFMWTPDFCPGKKPCILDLKKDWSGVNGFLRICPHHQAILNSGLTMNEVFEIILESSRAKENARAEIKKELQLEKDHPGVDFRVEDDGTIVVMIGEANIPKLAAIQAKVTARLNERAVLARTAHVSKVRVE